jgi:ribulose-phosphate 3-epimerase
MVDIIPAILEGSFVEIENKLARTKGHARTVQLDICDGVFTQAITWPYVSAPAEGKSFNYEESFKKIVAEEAEMPFWEEIDIELDLMVANAKRLLPDLLHIGPTRVVLHLASLTKPIDDMHSIARSIPGMVEIGLAVLPDADMNVVSAIIDERLISFVQCMGISEVGVQGSVVDESVLEKTCSNLRFLREKFPTLVLSVDGGVNMSTAKALTDAGATRLVSGSAIFSAESVQKAVAKFQSVI